MTGYPCWVTSTVSVVCPSYARRLPEVRYRVRLLVGNGVSGFVPYLLADLVLARDFPSGEFSVTGIKR